MVLDIDSVKQFDEILMDTGKIKHGKKYVIVDFYAKWCRPCVAFAPTFDELSKEYDGKFYFLKVNIDMNDDLSARYDIRSLPTFKVFDVGSLKSEYETIVGASKDRVVQRLKYLESKSSVVINPESFDF